MLVKHQGFPVQVLRFTVEVAMSLKGEGFLEGESHPIKSVFASYASEDREAPDLGKGGEPWAWMCSLIF